MIIIHLRVVLSSIPTVCFKVPRVVEYTTPHFSQGSNSVFIHELNRVVNRVEKFAVILCTTPTRTTDIMLMFAGSRVSSLRYQPATTPSQLTNHLDQNCIGDDGKLSAYACQVANGAVNATSLGDVQTFHDFHENTPGEMHILRSMYVIH